MRRKRETELQLTESMNLFTNYPLPGKIMHTPEQYQSGRHAKTKQKE